MFDLENFENYRVSLVTKIAYLIGVKEEFLFGSESHFDKEMIEDLNHNEKCKIIRDLTIIRMDYIRNYKSLSYGQSNLIPIESMPEYVNVDAIKELREKSIDVIKVDYSMTQKIAFINQYILENIDRIKDLFPNWIKWDYIKNLFLMPGCYSGMNGNNLQGSSGTKTISNINTYRKLIGTQKAFYPYATYVYWTENKMEKHYGNILLNDSKFLKLLYASYGDTFKANSYVIDAKAQTKDYVYNFISEATNVSVFVDCENVDPYKFASVFMNLDDGKISKVKKIILFDDVNTSTGWDYLGSFLNIPIEHRVIERVLENKSLVDIAITASACTEYFQNNTESIILASSDSDFWGLISSLKNANFLILNESSKASTTVLSKLEQYNINYCFMDDFAQDKVQDYKERVLFKNIQTIIEEFNTEGTFYYDTPNDLLDYVYNLAGISGNPNQVNQEKQTFYNKYLKNGFIIEPIEENGELTYKMKIYKK